MKHTITVFFLILAIALYVAGAAAPATALLVLGALSEGVFWFCALGFRRPKKRS